jgi:FMN-dependent NADH-azoreductase
VRVLHVIATPRGAGSNSLVLAEEFLRELRSLEPTVAVDHLDLFETDLPAIAGDNIEAKYTLMVGQPISRDHVESWRTIEALIEQFKGVDACVVTTPMWNLGIPYALKYYIDCIVQPGYLFRYDEVGRVVPMVHGKRMAFITTRGGDYSPGGPMHAYDFQEPYLRAIFGFVGVQDVDFVNAQPMDVTADLRVAALEEAVGRVRTLAASWAAGATVLDIRDARGESAQAQQVPAHGATVVAAQPNPAT